MDVIATKLSYQRYIHTLRVAYRLIANRDCSGELPSFDEVIGRGAICIDALVSAMKSRLGGIHPELCDSFLPVPYVQEMQFGSNVIRVPIINREGQDWYTVQDVMNFDFLTETFVGMHRDANVIYDIGGHQGVFANYYSGLVGPTGRIYSFEPSIVNIEIASLSFLLNQSNNIVLVPMGVGPRNDIVRSDSEGLVIAGAPANIIMVRPDWMMLEKPDFIKIDIEGFEYELIQAMPWLFDVCDNFHLEIHRPHLEARGLSYRDIYDLIPFDRFRVRKAVWGRLSEVDYGTDIDGFTALFLTRRSAR